MAKENGVNYVSSTVKCACGAEFDTMSTKEAVNIEVCSNCHPFYTGTQTRASKSSNVDKFNKKYGFNEQK